MEELRMVILQKMATKLDKEQLDMLATTLDVVLYDYTIEKKSTELTVIDKSNDILLKNFLGSKAIEGCSKRTARQYRECWMMSVRTSGILQQMIYVII